MNDRYLITGATGYIGSLLAEHLLNNHEQVRVIVRNPDKLKHSLRDRVEIITGDITDPAAMRQIISPCDYLVHAAACTQSRYMISNPVETAKSIVNGTQNLLELAVGCQVKSMVYLSSMEVYGWVDSRNDARTTEDELGELDILQIRSCYPMAKRMAENFCFLYHQEYGVPVKIARLAQTFGRGVGADDNRVFAQFAHAVREQRDIVLHTSGKTVGNYCDIDDVLHAILLLLECGKSGEAYNVVNEDNTMTILEMAELVSSRIADNKIRIIHDIPEHNSHGYACDTGLRLSASKLKGLGWKAVTGLEEMYRRML